MPFEEAARISSAIRHGRVEEAVHGLEVLEQLGAPAQMLGDLWWELTHLFESLDLPADATVARLKTWAWDRHIPRPEWALELTEAQALVDEAIRRLPARAQELLKQVPIILQDAPSLELVEDGMDPRLLGLFQGVPFPHKSVLDASPSAPDQITIYVENLEHSCPDVSAFVEELQKTVWHETAHAFGLDEDEVDALGLG